MAHDNAPDAPAERTYTATLSHPWTRFRGNKVDVYDAVENKIVPDVTHGEMIALRSCDHRSDHFVLNPTTKALAATKAASDAKTG